MLTIHRYLSSVHLFHDQYRYSIGCSTVITWTVLSFTVVRARLTCWNRAPPWCTGRRQLGQQPPAGSTDQLYVAYMILKGGCGRPHPHKKGESLGVRLGWGHRQSQSIHMYIHVCTHLNWSFHELCCCYRSEADMYLTILVYLPWDLHVSNDQQFMYICNMQTWGLDPPGWLHTIYIKGWGKWNIFCPSPPAKQKALKKKHDLFTKLWRMLAIKEYGFVTFDCALTWSRPVLWRHWEHLRVKSW